MSNSRSCVVCIAIVFSISFASSVSAQTRTGIRGRVTSGTTAITGATVRLLELDRQTHTDGSGAFSFANVPNGTYHVFVRVIGYASATKSVRVKDTIAEVDFSLKESAIQGEEIVISASPYARTSSEQYQSAASKSMLEMREEPGSSFAEELADLPGVDVRWNGSTPARPILRGLSNNEVLILENGLRTGDISTFDPAHSVPLEPEAVQEVDLVRGPASIMYGPNAIGGLVNVITNTIPIASVTPITGTFSLLGNSVNDLYSGHLNAVWSDGTSAISISGGGLHSDAISIPSASYTDPTTNQTYRLDTIPQSFARTYEFGAGYSYTGDFGMIGVGVKHFQSNYGIPGDPADTTYKAPTTSRIFQDKYTVELRALFETDGSFIKQVRLNSNATDYNHGEYPVVQDAATGVVSDINQNHFHDNGYNTTLQFIEERMGNWQGTLGLYSDFQNLSIDGQQPLGPNSLSSDLAGYVYEEYLASENTRLQAAIRYDYNHIQTRPSPSSTNPLFTNSDTSRVASAITGSFGIVQKLSTDLTATVSYGRSYRAPTVQELFAYGSDDASQAFMQGDTKLVPETGNGIDLSFKGRFTDFSFELSPYVNFISNYIYSFNTGTHNPLDTTYAVRQFTQTNARLFGIEATVTVQLVQSLALTASAGYVNASSISGDSVVPLPSTPPLKGILKLNYLDERYSGMIEWRLATAQTRLGDGDFPTTGYGVLNLGFGVHFNFGGAVHNVSLHCDNLLNQRYFDNLSAIGFFMPYPGRGFRLNYDVIF